ncbi:hypothetical protein HPB50_012098 [Hyalomma asiaticum]|uniref:Uncharacterized protein n=1 Tax=Hyalomma asiaticum TaxID=266040 RepID=A0ACB7SGA5_HYAAI|nr:hypothetical protein HPB50_012098 [Hyalomma asiaticum]
MERCPAQRGCEVAKRQDPDVPTREAYARPTKLLVSIKVCSPCSLLKRYQQQRNIGSDKFKAISFPRNANELLGVEGRLQNITINRHVKCPLLLPNRHHITHLVCTHAHRSVVHGAVTEMLNNATRTILSSTTSVKEINQPMPDVRSPAHEYRGNGASAVANLPA